MQTEELLTQRWEERNQLLQQTISLVESDPRITAAWLFGSGSRGDADALSDLDLWTVVADDTLPDLLAQRHTYVAQLGEPLLTLAVAGNAPVGGGYLMLQYPGQVGPFQVDWYWQPQSAAVLPDDAKLLFDQIGLPRAAGAKTIDVCYLARGITPPAPAIAPTTAQQVAHELTFAWCMSLIAAKYVARRAAEAAGQLFDYAAAKLAKAEELLHVAPTARLGQNSAPPSGPTLDEVLCNLRQLHQAAAGLLPDLAARGQPMPAALLPAITQFYDLAEAASHLGQPGNWVRRS